jgi:DNA-binding winged helix-turn-helix (wHTH) protein
LAERAAVSSRTVRDIERGAVTGPRRSTAISLADALQLSTTDRDRFLSAAAATSWKGLPAKAPFPPANDSGSVVPALRILGPVEVGSPGHPVHLPGTRQRKLLAALLLHAGAAVPFERLVDMLWETPPRSARQQLHNSVASLRRILAAMPGHGRITTTKTGYLLHVATESVDASLFRTAVAESERLDRLLQVPAALEVLERALKLWRGPALAGLSGGWLDEAAMQLNEQHVAAVERTTALRLRLGRTRSAHLPATARNADMIPATAEAPAAVALPGNFLPHNTKEFTGRKSDLHRLSDTALSSSPALVISAIDGMGGVGKTALAVHLAHKLTGHYADGQYFVDLHGFTSGQDPLTPAQALGHLLRQAGTEIEEIPPDLAGRSALWRSLLAGRRVIVLLDNAVDVAQVRPLIPGATDSLLIVTSRRSLAALEDAVPLSLNVLPPDDAQQLFTQIAGADRTADAPDGVARVIELCGRLPLAIRIAAARFRDRPRWTIEDLARKLQSRRSRDRILSAGDRDVMAVPRPSYRHLTPEQKRVFCLLSLHPGEDFDAYATAALADLPVPHAEQILEALFDDNLLLQQAADRYQFHGLIRDCSRLLMAAEISEEEMKAARHRLLETAVSRPNGNGRYEFFPPAEHGDGISTEVMAVLTALDLGIVHKLSDDPEAATPGV